MSIKKINESKSNYQKFLSKKYSIKTPNETQPTFTNATKKENTFYKKDSTNTKA